MLSGDTVSRAFMLGSFFGAKIAEKALNWLMGGVFGFLKSVFDFILDFAKNAGKVVIKLSGLVGKKLRFGGKKVEVTLKNINGRVGVDFSDSNKLVKNLNDNEFDDYIKSLEDNIPKQVLKDERDYLDVCKLFAFANEKQKADNWNPLSVSVYVDDCFPEIKLHKSVSSVLTGYTKKKSVHVSMTNATSLVDELKKISPGNWVKVYEAGYQNGKKVEVHYFKNLTNNDIFEPKIKYDEWHQKEFKNI